MNSEEEVITVKDKNIYKTNNENKKIDFFLKMKKWDYVKNVTKFVKYTLKCIKIKKIVLFSLVVSI